MNRAENLGKEKAAAASWKDFTKEAASRQVLKMAGKPLKIEILVRRNGELTPYDALTEAEKRALSESLNKRAIRTVAGLRGYDAEFPEPMRERKTEKKQD